MGKLVEKKRESFNKMMREEICSAVLKITRESGFNDLTMDKVAETLGTAKGTIYYYFKNKDDLILKTANMVSEPLLRKLFSISELGITSKEKLKMAAVMLIKHFEIYRDFHIMLHEQYGHKFFEKKSLKNEREEIYKCIKKILAKGIDEKEFRILSPEVAAECYIGTIMHLNISKTLIRKKRRKITDREIDEVLDLYFSGINNADNK